MNTNTKENTNMTNENTIDTSRVDLLWYEGDEANAQAFVDDIKARYGFDPSDGPEWDRDGTYDGTPERGFRCPTWEIREAVHDDTRYWDDPWPIGG
jgi:hypothetical protein